MLTIAKRKKISRAGEQNECDGLGTERISHRFGMRCGSVLATAAKLIGGTSAGPGGLACGVIGADTGAEIASCERDVVG